MFLKLEIVVASRILKCLFNEKCIYTEIERNMEVNI